MLPAAHSLESLRSDGGSLSKIIVDPPEIFSGGEDSETPTPPRDCSELATGGGSETVTPVVSPSGDGNLLSPLSVSVFAATDSMRCSDNGSDRLFSGSSKSFTPRPLSEIRARSESPAPSSNVRTLSDSALNRVGGNDDNFKSDAPITKKLTVYSSIEHSAKSTEAAVGAMPSFTLSEEGSCSVGSELGEHGTTL